ncbi:MAG: DUF364 domain-containing protein [Chloroflexota bacterium]|jgi:hypothetical protein
MNRETLLARLLPDLPDGKILDVHIGLYWTAVLAEADGAIRCGLSATMGREAHHTTNGTVANAGRLTELSARQLADYIHSPHSLEVSVGMAAINALLPPRPDLWVDLHSKEVLARLGAGKTVVMVGHFSYVPELRPQVGRLLVLELNPKDDQDLPAEAAPQVIPQADVLAVTAMTLLNHTFDELIALRRPGTPMVIVGPSTPLSTVLFEAGAVVLSGAVVENPTAVLRGLKEGASFHQLRRLGVRLVSMTADPALIDGLQ